jgi:CheY-like chemotaxis protein
MTKILLVEDNEMNRDMLSRRLVRKGHEIVLAVDGAECLALARSGQPDVILMDMSLPLITGWEATRILKGDAATKWIPIIGLTAHALSKSHDEAMQAGCDEFETKPVNLERLLEKIEILVTASALRKGESGNRLP